MRRRAVLRRQLRARRDRSLAKDIPSYPTRSAHAALTQAVAGGAGRGPAERCSSRCARCVQLPGRSGAQPAGGGRVVSKPLPETDSPLSPPTQPSRVAPSPAGASQKSRAAAARVRIALTQRNAKTQRPQWGSCVCCEGALLQQQGRPVRARGAGSVRGAMRRRDTQRSAAQRNPAGG